MNHLPTTLCPSAFDLGDQKTIAEDAEGRRTAERFNRPAAEQRAEETIGQRFGIIQVVPRKAGNIIGAFCPPPSVVMGFVSDIGESG